MTDGRHFQLRRCRCPTAMRLFTMVDVTDFEPHRGGAARARLGARGGRQGQDRLRRQHQLRIAHPADLDRRVRRNARRRLCRRAVAPRRSDYVDAILESVDRLSKLIDDVLDLTTGDKRGVDAGARAGRHRRAVPRRRSRPPRPRAAEKAQKLEAKIDRRRAASCSATRGGCAN